MTVMNKSKHEIMMEGLGKTIEKMMDECEQSFTRSTGYVLVNRPRSGGKEWKDVAIFSTQEEAKRMRDILESQDTKYTYNTKPSSLT